MLGQLTNEVESTTKKKITKMEKKKKYGKN